VSGRSVRDVVELHIVDAGPGRDAAAGASAFDLFARGPRSAADASGANLAMVVARRMIERMGGTVRAEAADHGITVVALPAID
jgi:K+-sensing histidine kinase KdpD